MDYNAITQLIQQKSKDYGQSEANFANLEPSLRQSMYGNDSVTNNLNDQEKSKIDELFSHDQNVANQYQQNPGLSTSPSGRVLDPYARELNLTNRYRNTAGELTDIRQNQQKRRDVIGDSLTNALKLAQQSLDLKKAEMDQLNTDREFAYKVAQGNKSGSGQSNVTDLFNAILGLNKKTQASAPSASGTAKTSADLAKVRAKYGQVNYTKNKDGSYSWNVPGEMVTPEEADPNAINKLAAGSIATGGSTTDVASIMQLLGLTGGGLNKPAADASGNGDITSLLGGSSTSTGNVGTIRVRLKSTGQTGTIPANEFDASIYDKI